MTAKKKQLLIESCEIVSKVKLPKKLKESLELSKGKAGTLIVRNIPVTILNRRNLNGRVYGTQVVQDAINAAQPLIESKQLLSQACEHPEGSYVSPTTASHVVIAAYIKPGISLTVDGKKGKYDVLFNDWEVLNTQEGKNLRALFEAECSIGVSIRGCGDLEGENVIDYEYLGTDCVGQPSSGTYTRMPVSESVKVEIEDREPMKEGFVVTTSSTNVVGDLEKAAVIQANLDNATYGTVVKTHTTLDSEVDPKTGATTEITTLEAETEDEVGTLDQALQMAKNAILNPTVNVDSVTIENVQEEDEVKTGGKKEAAPEYVPEETLNEEEKDPTYLALKKTGYYDFDDPEKYMEYINQNADKLDPMELADANSIHNKYLNGEINKELACHELQNISNAISLRTPFELSDSKKESVKEAKEKDPKEGKQFVLKAPNGYVSMEGNALTFRDDPKKALHFIVGKENTGLVHLSEVEKILDTMGVYDVQKYYKKDLGDISATADEQPKQEGLIGGDVNISTGDIASNNDVSLLPEANETLTEDNPSNTRYVATVRSEGKGNTADAETVPVSATDGQAILSEVGNLWKQKSKNGSENLVVVVKDTVNGDEFTYNPSSNVLEPMSMNTVTNTPIAEPTEDPQLTIEDPAVMESEDEAGIEQKDNKLTMTVNPEDDDPIEVEKEFDSTAQATVAKAGLEKGEIDGSIMLNEEDTAIKPGWYVGMDGVGVIGPYATEEEARQGLEAYGDRIDVLYLGENTELEEAGAGAAIGAGLGLPFGPLGAAAGGAIGSMAQDYFSNKQRPAGWKSGALLGGMVGGLPGALIGGGLQHMMTGDKGTLSNAGKAITKGAKAVGNGLKKGAAALKRGYQKATNSNDTTANQDAQQQAQATAQQDNKAQTGGVNDGIAPEQTQAAAEQQAQQAQTAQAQQQATQQQAAEQQAQQAQQAQAADVNAQVLQQVQSTQAQIEQALNQLQQLQLALQNSQLNTNIPIWQGKITRGKDGKFRSLRQEGVEEATEMDEVLFTDKPEASDPVVDQPLKDATKNPILKQQRIDMYNNPDPYKQDDGTYWKPGLELVKKEIDKYTNLSPEAKAAVAKLNEDSSANITVTLSDIDWDIDSIVAKASDDDSEFDVSDLDMSPEEYAVQADETNLKSSDDLLSLIQNLPNELTVSLHDVEISEDPRAIKQAILDAANAQTPYQINNATIVAVQ